MLIPMVLMPLLSCGADHHQQLGLSIALSRQQHYQLLEPIEPYLIFFLVPRRGCCSRVQSTLLFKVLSNMGWTSIGY